MPVLIPPLIPSNLELRLCPRLAYVPDTLPTTIRTYILCPGLSFGPSADTARNLIE